MSTTHLNGVEIHYEVIGSHGPWVAVIPGGRHSLSDLEPLARRIAARGYQVLVHDRRNCGRSSLTFDGTLGEDDIWADDLQALLGFLGAPPALVIGRSRGARVAIRFALRHRAKTRGLLLWGLSGGPAAARYLDDYYYLQYIRACRTGGMEAVCDLDHFAGLIAANPSNRRLLFETAADRFQQALEGWRSAFIANADQPVMGVGDDELHRIDVPTAIVPYYDRLHPFTTALYGHRAIPDSRFFDYAPWLRGNQRMTDSDQLAGVGKVVEILCDFEVGLRLV